MKLKDKIQLDIKTSMLNKDVKKLSLLRVVKGEIDRLGKDLSDDEIIKILRKMKENAVIINNLTEIEILNQYLPIMLEEKQLQSIIGGIIHKNNYCGLKDMGKVMTDLKVYGNQIDNGLASKIVKIMLH
jgi:uncharacterized protein YqeY